MGTLQLKPISGPIAEVDPQGGAPELYDNADAAGTAERYKQYVVAGAMGEGVPNFTGVRSTSASVIACDISRAAQTSPSRTTVLVMGVSLPRRRLVFAGGSNAETADRCFAFDLCAQVFYSDGSRLAVYSEGAAWCRPYVLDFVRTLGDRTLFSVTREVDHAPPGLFGCRHSRDTRIPLDGGRAMLSISQNGDGTLKFRFVPLP